MVVDSRKVQDAAERIGDVVRTTPVLSVPGEEIDSTGSLHLKLEQLQHSGSFKARGASNTLLASSVPTAGVVAASGGNHGAAVAWAAARQGHRATIFVPTIADPAKIDRLRSYGAEVRVEGEVFADALAASHGFQIQSGALPVHAYDQELVVAGAGTVGLELESQVGSIDSVLVACGGGGLAGGLAAWFEERTAIVVVETEGTRTFADAIAAGRPVPVPITGLAADSLGASQLGGTGWSTLSKARTESVIVSDDEVRSARAQLWDRFRLVVEPAAAAPIAALLTGRYRPAQGASVGVIVCGANTSLG